MSHTADWMSFTNIKGLKADTMIFDEFTSEADRERLLGNWNNDFKKRNEKQRLPSITERYKHTEKAGLFE